MIEIELMIKCSSADSTPSLGSKVFNDFSFSSSVVGCIRTSFKFKQKIIYFPLCAIRKLFELFSKEPCCFWKDKVAH